MKGHYTVTIIFDKTAVFMEKAVLLAVLREGGMHGAASMAVSEK